MNWGEEVEEIYVTTGEEKAKNCHFKTKKRLYK